MKQHIEKTSWALNWLALVVLFVVQIIAAQQGAKDRQEIKDALRVKPYQVMERLEAIAAELDRRGAAFDELKAKGLITEAPGP